MTWKQQKNLFLHICVFSIFTRNWSSAAEASVSFTVFRFLVLLSAACRAVLWANCMCLCTDAPDSVEIYTIVNVEIGVQNTLICHVTKGCMCAKQWKCVQWSLIIWSEIKKTSRKCWSQHKDWLFTDVKVHVSLCLCRGGGRWIHSGTCNILWSGSDCRCPRRGSRNLSLHPRKKVMPIGWC